MKVCGFILKNFGEQDVLGSCTTRVEWREECHCCCEKMKRPFLVKKKSIFHLRDLLWFKQWKIRLLIDTRFSEERHGAKLQKHFANN